jgi:hypothetical protein
MLITTTLALLAAQAAVPVTAGASRPGLDPAGIVCKTEKKSNSRFTEKTCRSRAEWSALEEAHKRAARELIERPGFDARRGN